MLLCSNQLSFSIFDELADINEPIPLQVFSSCTVHDSTHDRKQLHLIIQFT